MRLRPMEAITCGLTRQRSADTGRSVRVRNGLADRLFLPRIRAVQQPKPCPHLMCLPILTLREQLGLPFHPPTIYRVGIYTDDLFP